MSLGETSLEVMGYFKKVNLSIVTGYTMSIITLRFIPIYVSLRKLFLTVSNFLMIVALFLFTYTKVITARSWFYPLGVKRSV